MLEAKPETRLSSEETFNLKASATAKEATEALATVENFIVNISFLCGLFLMEKKLGLGVFSHSYILVVSMARG